MTPLLILLAAAFVVLAVVWPLSFFGYHFYAEVVGAEERKHAEHGGALRRANKL